MKRIAIAVVFLTGVGLVGGSPGISQVLAASHLSHSYCSSVRFGCSDASPKHHHFSRQLRTRSHKGRNVCQSVGSWCTDDGRNP